MSNGGERTTNWWHDAFVLADNGVHTVFYASSQPVMGSHCGGVAGPNKVCGFRKYERPDVKSAVRIASDYTSRANYQSQYAANNREAINARKREWRKRTGKH